MTLEELKQIKFREIAHFALEKEYVSNYIAHLPDELKGDISLTATATTKRDACGFAIGKARVEYTYWDKTAKMHIARTLEKLLELINNDLQC
jgi:hypothetical protein